MAVRLAFFFVCFLVVIYMIQAAEVKAAQEKSASETIDETLGKIKSGIDDFVTKVKSNEFVQNASQALEHFGEQVQAKGKEIINKLKADEK